MASYFPIQRIEDFGQCQALKESYEEPTGDCRIILNNDPSYPILTHASDSEKEHITEKYAKTIKKSNTFTDPIFQLMSLQEHTVTLRSYLQNYVELFQLKSQPSFKNTKSQDAKTQNNGKLIEYGQKYKKYLENIKQALSSEKSTNILKHWQFQQKINQISTSLQKISYLTSQQKQLIIQTSKKCQKIGKFFNLLLSGLIKQFLNPLIKISILAFKQWNIYKEQRLTQQQLIITGKKLVKQKILPVCWKYFKGCKKSLVQEFSNYYMVTIMFLLADYFVNPYYQIEHELVVPQFALYETLLYNNGSNRPKSESEESQELRKVFKCNQ